MTGAQAKLVAWTVVGVLGLASALAASSSLPSYEDGNRVLISVGATLLWAIVGWEVYHRPWAARRDQAQELTNTAARVIDRDPAEALVLLAQAQALYESQRTNLNLGCALHSLGYHKLAKDYYEAASPPGCDDQQTAGEACLELARLHSLDRDWEWVDNRAGRALRLLEPGAKEDRASAHLFRAMAKWQQGRESEAREEFMSGLAENPSSGLQQTIRSLVAALTLAGAGGSSEDAWHLMIQVTREPGRLN